MNIANPIYDVVFKYLLEDLEIARELLSTILGANITWLQVKPQETLVQDDNGEIKIFHLDFKATIDLEGGKQKTVLIELQKAKKSYDILRFRKYLGENYAKEEVRKNEKGELESYSLEIVSIYILGFKLDGVNVPVLKVSRKFEDAITHEEVLANNEFIFNLTHESYTIQIPRLQNHQRNQLEEVLEIFSQDNVTDDLHILNFTKQAKNPLVKKMLRRLSKAAADEKIKKTMDAEDMIARLISREMAQKVKEYEEKLKESEAEKQKIMQEKQQIEQEKQQIEQENQREKEELIRQLKELQDRLKKE